VSFLATTLLEDNKLTQDRIFGSNSENSLNDFIRNLSTITATDSSICTLVVKEVMDELDKQEELEKVMSVITEICYESLQTPITSRTARTILDEFPASVSILILFAVNNKKAAKFVSQSPCMQVNPDRVNPVMSHNLMMLQSRHGARFIEAGGMAGKTFGS